MLKLLTTLTILALLTIAVAYPQPTIAPLLQSTVRIVIYRLDPAHGKMEEYCTGFYVETRRILSAAHCIGKNHSVDGQDITVLKTDPILDLALFEAHKDGTPLKFRDDPPAIGEHLFSYGFPFGWTKLSSIEVKAFAVNAELDSKMPVGLVVVRGYMKGMSGGPVVDANGEVVSIVQRSNPDIGYGVGALQMRTFLLGTE